MSNLNISGFLNSSARSNHALDKFLSAISNNDPDQSYLEMQSYLEEMKQSKQKDPIDEIEMFFTPHKCPKIAEVEKDLETTIQQINELQICDQATYQASLIKIKSVKKVITQIVDKYFLNLKNQYNFIANELVQISLAPIKKLIYQLRTDLSNYDEDQLNEIVVRQNQIREEINNFKMQLPKDIKLQISNQSISDIKTSLFKLISIAFKGNLVLYLDPFSIIPANFKGFQLQKKNQVQLKSKKGQMKLQEQLDSTYSYRNNALYYSQADTIAEVQMIKCSLNNDPNQKLSLCNIINTADSLYFLGFLYEDTISKQKLLNNKLTRLKKQDNSLLDLTEMPIFTYGGQVIKFENNIYYWGGHILSDDQYINSKKGFKYSIRENVWDQIESMKYPRINGQCCVSDSKIYITGGMMNQFQGNPLIEIFDATILKFNEPIELVNQLSYIPQILGYSFPISQQEILIIGGYNQYGNDENAQLINLFLKTVQRNQTKLPRILSLNCSQPMICQQQIHLFNSEQQKIELLSITTDTFQIQKIIPLQ